MTSLLFICHGNICRSPMAEFVMKDIIHDRHADDFFHVESAAATTEELGHDMYPPVKKLLSAKNISFEPRKARLFTAKDYIAFDYILPWIMKIYKIYIISRAMTRKKKFLSFYPGAVNEKK